MNRKKKLILNTTSGILYQVVTLLCGFILPRFFLMYYGSEVNGLVTSISQFLGFITLAECGVGAVVQSTLYKPLAKNDETEVSKIVVSADKFFKKIAFILVGYVAILTCVYPLFVKDLFDTVFTVSLILVISISLFVQYYLSMSYRLLMNADQIGFIHVIVQTIILIFNAIFSIVLMKCGAGIHIVKLVTTLLHLIPPFIIVIYIKKHYKVNRKVKVEGEPIKQKWNGMAQHVSAVILNNTDVVVLTAFSTLVNVSIYNVYHMVVFGLANLIKSGMSGIQALFGNMLAKKEEKLQKTFSVYELVVHFIVTVLFVCAGLLIIPFVKVYTKGITDANYIVPLFAIILTAAQASYCLRLPYNTMVLAAGHYKQTQKSAIIEMLINVILSIILVINFGLIGVAIGTLIAMTYRTIYLACYLRKNIMHRKLRHFIKHIVVDFIILVLSVLACYYVKLGNVNYLSWFVMAIKCALVVGAIALIVNFIFYRNNFMDLFKNIKKKLTKRKQKNGENKMKNVITLKNKTILVTGSAGFIGSNLVTNLLKNEENIKIIGLDNINDYYDVSLKEYRLEQINKLSKEKKKCEYLFIKGDIADKSLVEKIFKEHNPQIVVNLAAQAGVRYSIDHPDVYIESNIIGFYNILEACRNYPVEHLVYASSSSVYGSNKKVPYSTDDKVDNPVSLYAATKKSNELLAHAYSKLYNIACTGLRFFTVYGPAGRPDMAYFGFTNKLIRGEKIKIFNYGNCKRDFTYIDDIVEGVVRTMKRPPEKSVGTDGLPIPPYQLFNIGNGNPENLLDFVQILQEELVRAGVLKEDYNFEEYKELVPMQPGDVEVTFADTKELEETVGFKPKTSLRDGLREFAKWYKNFYN